MTTTTTAAEETTEDGALTVEEMAEILTAQALIFKVCNTAAARELEQGLPAARQRVQDAQQAAEQARQAWEPAQATMDHLTAELAECERRAANVDHVVSDEADLAARIEARSLVIAFREEAEALRQRISMTRQITAPLVAANGEAAAELATAQAALTSLEQAISLPFAHELGRATAPYPVYQLNTGLWFQDLNSATAKAILRFALAQSGLGAEIETRAIEAYRAGDPSALAAAGASKRWEDGTVLVDPGNGGPPVVSRRASPEQLRNLPGRPLPDTTPGAQQIAAEWARTGYAREQRPGMPGIHHATEQRLPPAGRTIGK